MRCAVVILAAVLASPDAGWAAVASCYGAESGPHTASGERFIPSQMTAAMCTIGGCDLRERASWLPFGTLLRVSYQGRSVVVRLNDRGPWIKHRAIDLSSGACDRLGLPGIGDVQIEVTSAPYRPKRGDWGVF